MIWEAIIAGSRRNARANTGQNCAVHCDLQLWIQRALDENTSAPFSDLFDNLKVDNTFAIADFKRS